MEIRYATKNLLGSVWTLAFKVIEPGKAEIISYNRESPIGYEKEKQLPRLQMLENDKRIVGGFLLAPYEPFAYWASEEKANERFEVINPKHIFSY